jgi:MinD-like ATPase involved in chromosome partitioning or flagellar assembly
MGLANAAILLGMPTAWTIGDLLAGRCGVDDLLQTGPAGLRFLPGHSGTGSGSTLSAAERARLMEALEPHLSDYDHVVIDTGGGIEASALALVATADTPLIVLTPEPTSFVDAYAMVKALNVAHGTSGFDIVANQVRHDVAGRAFGLREHRVAMFRLPLQEFTGARNALASRLQKAGRKDEAAKVIPDELVDDSAIVGDLAYVQEQIKAWEAAGVTMMVVGARSSDQIRDLAALV